MARNPKFFGRKYRLSIMPPKGGQYIFETENGKPAMDIKFDVTYARGQTAREGTISILGLSRERMTELLTLAGMTRGKAMSQLIRIKLEAGYFTDAGMVEVLNGFAWYATVTAPPQMWINIKVSEYNPMGARKVELPSVNETINVRTLVENFLANFTEVEGVTFRVQDKTQNQILDQDKSIKLQFSQAVSLGELIQELNKSCSDDLFFLLKTSNDEENTRTLLALDKDNKKVTNSRPVLVDGENGLLSVTGIDAVNGCITTFIDGTVSEEMTHLDLQSSLNKQANGRYYIVKKQFVGHYMGQEWYTRYFCSAREGDDEQAEQNRQVTA